MSPPGHNRGHAPNATTTAAAAAIQAARARPFPALTAASISTASPGATHTQW